jgi:hypothetical protein
MPREGKQIDDVKVKAQQTAAAVKDADTSISASAKTAGTTAANASRAAGYLVAAAVRASTPTVITTVNVSATTVEQKTTVVKRYGSVGGDRIQGGSGVTHNGAD